MEFILIFIYLFFIGKYIIDPKKVPQFSIPDMTGLFFLKKKKKLKN